MKFKSIIITLILCVGLSQVALGQEASSDTNKDLPPLFKVRVLGAIGFGGVTSRVIDENYYNDTQIALGFMAQGRIALGDIASIIVETGYRKFAKYLHIYTPGYDVTYKLFQIGAGFEFNHGLRRRIQTYTGFTLGIGFDSSSYGAAVTDQHILGTTVMFALYSGADINVNDLIFIPIQIRLDLGIAEGEKVESRTNRGDPVVAGLTLNAGVGFRF